MEILSSKTANLGSRGLVEGEWALLHVKGYINWAKDIKRKEVLFGDGKSRKKSFYRRQKQKNNI